MREPDIIQRLGAFIAPGDPEPAQLAVAQQLIIDGLAVALNRHGWAHPPLAVTSAPHQGALEIRCPDQAHTDAATELAETIATELATAGLAGIVHEVWVVIAPDRALGYFEPGHPPRWVDTASG